MGSLETFRKESRAWLEENCPPAMREPISANERVWASSSIQFPSEDARLWFERMVEKGWCVPEWPQEYGGAGLSPDEARILSEEITALSCRDPQYSFGITMIGPVLLEFGTEEQKREFLPRIARGEIRWCQGYSEPGAGSDLAGLRTTAEDCGDHYIVNGTKIWTSDADQADWMYCLVRTDPNAPKQRGISFLLFDMHQPGITVKPIRLISGSSPFCEVFLDQVRAEKHHRVGEENRGWSVAKRLLEYERAMMADLAGESRNPITPLSIAKEALEWENGRIRDPGFRDRLAGHLINRHSAELTNKRAAMEIEAKVPALTAMVLKYAGTEEEKRGQYLMSDMLGHGGLGWEGQEFTAEELEVIRSWLISHSYTIAGGSSEVQLNIIAKHALNLPV